MKKVLCLCEARHAMPSDCEGAIFGNTINPLDLAGMAAVTAEKLSGVAELRLYVTGLTVALVTVINYCVSNGVKLTLLHFDRESGGYYEQEVAVK